MLLFAMVTIITLPSFFDPPRSDHWTLFHFFHHLDSLPGYMPSLHIMNWDPFSQVRFQPLAFYLSYVLLLAFAPEFLYFHLANLLMYFVFLVVLYRFAFIFCPNRNFRFLSVFLFSILYSHFDIVSWPFHIYIITGITLCLIGFLSYMRFCTTGQWGLFWLSLAAWLGGVFCYEPFVLWPCSILLLRGRGRRAKTLLVLLYAVYIAMFLFTRTLDTYTQPRMELASLYSPQVAMLTTFAVPANIFYNNFAVNLCPWFALPARFNHDSFEMTGPLPETTKQFDRSIIRGGVFMLCCCGLLLLLLRSRKHFFLFNRMLLLFFLYFSFYWPLFYLRGISNTLTFTMQQFRYHLVGNALWVIFIAIFLNRLWQWSRRFSLFIITLLLIVAISNLWFSTAQVLYIHKELQPLATLLNTIRTGIDNNTITPDRPLYLDDSIVDHLPPLSWNQEMGIKFMDGTYQWQFHPNQIGCFSFSPDEAAWQVNADNDGIRLVQQNHSPDGQRSEGN